ncbi:MAG TPA: hemerythrin domain-containing protein [Bdellovibrionota bacterium]|jgi:iron-sulfur cluster repair protein YtfE (RIC family)|nr:hemerythrin domain-containing protein [Bdellovibrionota bacterium]
MDAIDLLKSDHRKVENLFNLTRQAQTVDEKRAIFRKVKAELEAHARVEETIFYPAFSQYESFDDILDESYQEHQDIQDMLVEMEDMQDDEEFQDMIEDLREEVEHHVHEEETVFFPKVRDVMDQQELDRLARMIQDAREGTARRAA